MEPGTLAHELSSLKPLISAGITAADMMNLDRELQSVLKAGIRMLHFDVMDGRFCPGLTFGPAFIRAVKTELLKDVHLMVGDPVAMLGDVVAAGADVVTINIESTSHIHRAFQILGDSENVNDPERGIVRGAVLNPGTPVEDVGPLLEYVEIVMLLSVNPGWSGQKFIASTGERCRKLKEMIQAFGKDIMVAVDGGITMETISEAAAMGTDIVASGSAIFDGKDPGGNAAKMIDLLRKRRRNT